MYGVVGFLRGDLTHRVRFTEKYHDFGEKKVLGEIIPSGLSGDDDVKAAIDIIFHQSSVAPYIAKKLIMRLTKSNPSQDYIKRVALTFKNSNFDLKETIKAIYLDPELWDDLKNNKIIKFKEPQIAMTQFLRNFYVKPQPKWFFCGFENRVTHSNPQCVTVENEYLFGDTREFLGQGPGLAPTVFNFYDDNYIPNNKYFKEHNLVAPELQIQTDGMIIKFSRIVQFYLSNYEKTITLDRYYSNDNNKQYKTYDEYIEGQANKSYQLSYIGMDKFIIDAKDELNLVEKIIDGDTNGDFANLVDYRDNNHTKEEQALEALIDFEDKKLTGGLLTEEEKKTLFEHFKTLLYDKNRTHYTKRQLVYERMITPIVRSIITSSKYMLE